MTAGTLGVGFKATLQPAVGDVTKILSNARGTQEVPGESQEEGEPGKEPRREPGREPGRASEWPGEARRCQEEPERVPGKAREEPLRKFPRFGLSSQGNLNQEIVLV